MSAKVGPGIWSSARRLAGSELRRSWRSFLLTAFVTAVLGLFASTLVYGFYEVEGLTNFVIDLFFLLICANLALNFTAADYLQFSEDPLSKRLRFLRSLPVAARDLAAGRAAALLVTLAVMVPVFFVTLYLASGGLRAEFGPAGYLSFVGVWSGYALAMGALEMYLEWGFPGSRLFVFQLIWIVALVAAALAAGSLGWPVFGGVVDLSGAYGASAAVAALLAGFLALALSVWATARRLGGRDLSA